MRRHWRAFRIRLGFYFHIETSWKMKNLLYEDDEELLPQSGKLGQPGQMPAWLHATPAKFGAAAPLGKRLCRSFSVQALQL